MEEKSPFCDCLYFSANSLSRNLTRIAEESFSMTGLAPSYAFALMSINKEPGISPSTVARQMHMTPSTITRFLDKLEVKGYITRKLEGKKSSLMPTEKGEELQKNLEQAWEELLDKYNAVLGESNAGTLAQEIYEASEKLKE